MSIKTRSVYRSVIRNFLTRVYGSFSEEDDGLETHASKYLKDQRNYPSDISSFVEHEKENSNSYTIRIQLSVIRTFLFENDIELPHKFWRGLNKRIKGTRAVTQDKIPTPYELKSILGYMPKWGRAYFLMLATSGMRPNEALQLKLSDIELDRTPPKILLKAGYTKTGNSRFKFMSSEAKEALVEYLKERNPSDDRIFPFQYIDVYKLWKRATKRNGFKQTDPQFGHQLLHPYTLRKFFRTNLGAVSNIIPVDVIEALMGHEMYLRDVYKKYSDDLIADLYLKSEHAVLVFSSSERIKDEMRMNSKLENLVSENQEFKRKMSETDKILDEVLQSLEQLKAQDLIAFMENDIELPQNFWRGLGKRIKGTNASALEADFARNRNHYFIGKNGQKLSL